jgi:hypothetical protein
MNNPRTVSISSNRTVIEGAACVCGLVSPDRDPILFLPFDHFAFNDPSKVHPRLRCILTGD